MNRTLKWLMLMCGSVGLASCAHAGNTESSPKCDYYAIARAEIIKHSPNYPLDARTMAHKNRLTIVEVFYLLPEDAMGGGPIVKIRKSDCTVKDITFWE
ncbi:hypothetical protein [Asticcacaulis sp. YBE204]|uniref:hypothetical protein n=1 Tax=Asticcacaulis sp. YBE204 TaxID=1282363 RepID=UPI0003C3F465|nr:hypothetical protein [Asticcacaulis sp. YBE204]ESQ79870.1 hypothetical protein AEYBE204_08470 [Asticcacaulis sp. YBE204]